MWAFQAQTQRQPEEWVHALPRAEPALIWITLKLDRGALVYEPSLEQALPPTSLLSSPPRMQAPFRRYERLPLCIQVVDKLREVLEAFVEQTENIPMIRQKGARASEHVRSRGMDRWW